jgi:polyhydroxyalkanoate synthesis regulator phasin
MTKKTTIILGSVGALAFIFIAAGGAFVSAQSTDTATKFLDRVAQIAGVDAQKLKDSIKQASQEEVDQKVKEGKLSQEEAGVIKKNMDEGNFYGFGMGVRGPKGPMIEKGIMAPDFEDISTFLGITPTDLKDQIRNGKTLLEVAKDKGKSEADLKSFLTNKFDENLKQAVTDGKLTQAEADRISEKRDEMISHLIEGKGPGGHPGDRIIKRMR